MKRAYLIMSITLLLGGCEKEDDPVDPPIDNTPNKGSITFYVDFDDKDLIDKIDFPITIEVNDSLWEKPLNGASSGPVNCFQPSTLGKRIFMAPGTYTWRALDEAKSWGDSGTVTFIADQCTIENMK